MIAPDRFLAIDWSGANSPAAQRKHIVAAEVATAHIPTSPDVAKRNIAGNHVGLPSMLLHSGRTRQELIEWLCKNHATRYKSAVIGFDFSFSLPASFLRRHGCCSVQELWELVAREGEQWLRRTPVPFWGRPGKKRPPMAPEDVLRTTERAINVHGIQPKSTFQIGGAGAAGTGSLRGMPLLLQLRQAGFSIWPFDPPQLPMVVEIYPRLLTGPVRKSNREERLRYLSASRFAHLAEDIRNETAASEDAFDALVSTLVMAEHAAAFPHLRQATDPHELLEGQIWRPRNSGNGNPP
jgi:hypothetical protein